MPPLCLLALAVFVMLAECQRRQPPNSFPHDYPGNPSGDFSPAFQDYFEVHDLPNVTFPLPRNWAGSIPVDRPNHSNDTLFFWAFERENGSLTSSANERLDEPWAIWLNGGPGASSMLGLLLENGPLLVRENGSLAPNPFSWDKLVDYVWVDQPVGTGYSTADSAGYIANEDQMGEDFLGFLSNLVEIFPSLATRPLLLTGESYAGTYIPYITKALFSTRNPPVNLRKIVIGNGAMGSFAEYEELPMLAVIETYPQLIGYDPEVYEYFKEQTHLCGYDLNLTYPQAEPLPPVPIIFPPGFDSDSRTSILIDRARLANRRKALQSMLLSKGNVPDASPAPNRRDVRARARRRLSELGLPANIGRRQVYKRKRFLQERENRRAAWKRDLSGRANGTIDPFYGCFLLDEIMDYAQNFSFPWNLSEPTVIESLDAFAPLNPYNIPDARNPPVGLDPTPFLNDNRTRAALHAPTSKNWILQLNYPFNSSFAAAPGANPFGDPSQEPVLFLSELATNASEHGVNVVIYSGNDDSVVAHISSEITIQNTTFGGIRGFTRKPATPFTDDEGNFIGIIHQERNWTYALIDHAGHEVPEYAPEAAFVFFREFILGNNPTGLVTNSPDGASVIGGESSALTHDILPGQVSILYGSGTALSTALYPSATIAAWEEFIATAATAPAGAGTGAGTGVKQTVAPTEAGAASGANALIGQPAAAISYLAVTVLAALSSLM